MNFIQRLFSTDDFMPHGMCYEWNPSVIWLHTLSDGFTALAYYSIPLTLIYLVRKRQDLAFNWMFLCFAIFIIACGTTHIMEIVSIWHPAYWLFGMIKLITAITSVITAILLIKLLPQILALPSPRQMRAANLALQSEIEEKVRALKNIETLNQKLLVQSTKLEAANTELESFSYSISHDLRAPLRAILGFSEVLQEDFSPALPEPAKNYLRRIQQGAERLDKLTGELLQYSRVTKIEMAMEPVDLDLLTRTIIAEYPHLQAQSTQIQIEGILPTVMGYHSGLTQVIANLIGNGLKFVQPGKKPEVTLQAEINRSTGFARIWFMDQGIGISDEDQKRIFKIFERVESANAYEGTGVGLALVKKTVDRMQGRAGVESALGKGSRFWIELPLAG